MTMFRLTFTELKQKEQELGGDDECMESIVFYRVEVNGETHEVDSLIKQVVGSKIDPDNIEVWLPESYAGPPFSHSKLQEAAAKYFMSWVGPEGRGIRTDQVTRDVKVKMKDNTFKGEY